MNKTYVFRESWPYHFDPLFDWISALPICSSAKLLLARLHNNNRTLERVKRGETGPFTFPWELKEIARTFHRVNSAVTKWRGELESCGAADYESGCWTLPVPEFFRETRITTFTTTKHPTLLKEREERNSFSRTGLRENASVGKKKRAKAHAIKRKLKDLHWDNCKVRFDEGVVFTFADWAVNSGFLEADIIAAYDRALHLNHGQATDCEKVWDTGSTVHDARQTLGKISRRFEPARFDPDIARKVRESMSSVSDANDDGDSASPITQGELL